MGDEYIGKRIHEAFFSLLRRYVFECEGKEVIFDNIQVWHMMLNIS